MNNPINAEEAAEAVYDMIGTAANIASPLTATESYRDGNRFTVTLAREHNETVTDHQTFIVTVEPTIVQDAPRTIHDVEKEHILKTITQCQGKKPEAAQQLGISLKTLYNKLKSYNES